MASSTTADVLIRYKADTSQAQAATRAYGGETVKTSQRIKGAVAGIAPALAGAFAGAAVVKFLGDSIRAASDLHETVSKTEQVFGPASAAVLDWSKTTADSMGQSQQQALDAAATFGIFGKAAGLTGDSLSGFSTDLTGLASDMASFSNTTPQDAIEALAAGLRGESEPLRKYGVLLDEATLRQAAMALGIVKTTKQALTPQQRVLAAQKVIMEQTKTAQGDFARTSGGLANQQRILAARMANLKVTIGSALLPVVLVMVTVMGKVINVFVALASWVSSNADILGPIAIGIVALTLALSANAIATGIASAATAIYSTILLNARIAMLLFNAAVAANPILLIIALVIALAVVFVVLYKRVTWFRNAVNAVFRALAVAAQVLAAAFMVAFRFIATVVRIYIGIYVAIIRAVITVTLAVFTAIGRAIWGPLSAAWRLAVALVRAYIGVYIAVIRLVVGATRAALSGVYNAVTSGFRAAWGYVRRIGALLGSAFGGVAGAISRALSGVFGAIIGPFQAAWHWIQRFVINPITAGWNRIAGLINAVSFSYTVPSNAITKFLKIAGKGFTFSLPHIPTLATGAYVTGPTPAIVGEAGHEFVLPEAMLRKVVRQETGGTTIIVNGALDPDAVARQIESILTRRARRVRGPQRVGAPA